MMKHHADGCYRPDETGKTYYAATQARGNERQKPKTRCYKADCYSFTAQLRSHLTKTRRVSITKTNQIMLFGEVITSYCDSRANYISTLCAKKKS